MTLFSVCASFPPFSQSVRGQKNGENPDQIGNVCGRPELVMHMLKTCLYGLLALRWVRAAASEGVAICMLSHARGLLPCSLAARWRREFGLTRVTCPHWVVHPVDSRVQEACIVNVGERIEAAARTLTGWLSGCRGMENTWGAKVSARNIV